MRMHGHSASDDASYVPNGMIEEWKEKDPVEGYERKLLAMGILGEAGKDTTRSSILAEIQEAGKICGGGAIPVAEDVHRGVYAD